jgi:prophage regulatory protein
MKPQPIAADQTTPTKLLRKPAVLERVPMSDTTLWRRVKDGGFPAPVKISTNAIAWRESDVDHWIESRKERA